LKVTTNLSLIRRFPIRTPLIHGYLKFGFPKIQSISSPAVNSSGNVAGQYGKKKKIAEQFESKFVNIFNNHVIKSALVSNISMLESLTN
jgi:hypothetical protein